MAAFNELEVILEAFMTSVKKLGMCLEAQGLSTVVVHNLYVNTNTSTLYNTLIVNVLLVAAKVSLSEEYPICTNTHHLVMGGAYVNGTACGQISEWVVTACGMSADMLVHLATRHDVKELPTTTDA